MVSELEYKDGNVLGSLIFQKHRYAILKSLSEKSDSPTLLSIKLEIPVKKIYAHLSVLHKFGLVEKLPKPPSLFKEGRKTLYQPYKITKLGLQVLAEYEKKPEV
ncbi:MAG: helix-turn-helix domain-containing protein [Candidatus Micrarchaeia archaeon]